MTDYGEASNEEKDANAEDACEQGMKRISAKTSERDKAKARRKGKARKEK